MDQERSKRRMRVSARENIDDVTTKTTTAILIPCYNEELTVQVVILGEAKILDLERDRLGRRVRIEVLPEVNEQCRASTRPAPPALVSSSHGSLLRNRRRQGDHKSQQFAARTFTIAWKITGIPVVNFRKARRS